MVAAIISIGDELLIGRTQDTNAHYIAVQLNKLGIRLYRTITVSDDKAEIIEAINSLRLNVDIIFTIGGLGVTGDDITKRVVAEYLRLKLVYDPTGISKIEEFCAANDIECTDVLRNFALVVNKSIPLSNDVGIAEGCIVRANDKLDLILLPGPPKELESMVQRLVIPYLKEKIGTRYATTAFKIFGIKEVDVFLKIKDLIDKYRDKVIITTYCSILEVAIIVRFDATKDNEIAKIALAEIYERLKSNIFASSDILIEEALINKLKKKHKVLATAESLTGGSIASSLVAISGASEVYHEGIVCYSNESKSTRLGVKERTLKVFGAVSEETAREMCEGLLKNTNVDLAISTTGIAGPTGATEDKPVGLCYIGIGTQNGIIVYKHIFKNADRDEVRERVRKTALFYAIKSIN